jgi:hypothetical protein
MDQDVHPLEGAGQIARRAQIGPDHLERGAPGERTQIRRRPDQGPDLYAAGKQSLDHVPAEEPVGAGDKRPHPSCTFGLRASTIRATSSMERAVTGGQDLAANAR